MLQLIPQITNTFEKIQPQDFTRTRKLPLDKLITFVLSLTSSGKNGGVDTKAGAFFKHARRSALWEEALPADRSAVTKARHKLPWQAFDTLLRDAVTLAYEMFPSRNEYEWNGLSVFAFDGSKYRLPASAELRERFDPASGLDKPGKGHYPQCLVTTAYDVLRRLPIARTVTSIEDGHEREEALRMLPQLPQDGVVLFDRGYPSFGFFAALNEGYSGLYVVRSPAKSTFPAVEQFVRSGEAETIVQIKPSNHYLATLPVEQRKNIHPIRLRAIRQVSPEGVVSILLSNLFDAHRFSMQEVLALYCKRWAIENHYRHEKHALDIEVFHSRCSNGICQELFAVLVCAVITRTITALCVESESIETERSRVQPSIKHAVIAFATEAALLTPDDPETAFAIFAELLSAIRRVKYYKPKIQRASQPRVTKAPLNKWQQARTMRREQAHA